MALAQKFATNISRKRAQVDETAVKTFFDHLEKEIQDVPPTNIYNFDETGFHDNAKKGNLLFRRACRHPERVQNSTKSSYTTMFCGNAVGEFVPPYIILKGKQNWSDWLYCAPSQTKLNVSDHGWINQEIFEDWFEYQFLPHAMKNPGKKVIIGDNLSSHITIKTLKLCAENNVVFVCLIPNSTHLIQPLDVGYFSSLKTCWRKVLLDWRQTKEGKKAIALPKSLFAQLLKHTLELGASTASANLIKGFESTGIFPLNSSRVLSKLPAYAKHNYSAIEKVGEQFIKYLDGVRTSDLQTVQKGKKFCLPIQPGKSVSAEEVEEFYTKRQAAAASKLSRGRPRTRGGGAQARGSGVKTRGGGVTRQGSTNQHVTSTPEHNSSTSICSEKTECSMGSQESDHSEVEREQQLEELDLEGINTTDNILTVSNATNAATPELHCALTSSEHQAVVVEHIVCGNLVVTENANLEVLPVLNFSVGDHVIVIYEGEFFPGNITGQKVENNSVMYNVCCMQRSGTHWKWPNKVDEMYYSGTDVYKKIDPKDIVPVSNRGVFTVNDPLLGRWVTV